MVRLGRPAGDRPPPPSTRPTRSPLALSLVLHGLIGLPLLAAGSAGSASTEQPPLLVDIALVSAASASTSAAGTEASATAPAPPTEPTARTAVPPPIPLPPPEELPPPDTSATTIERQTIPIEHEARTTDRETRIDLPPPDEPPPLDMATQKMEREIKIDLAPAEEPPPLDTSTLRPVEPPKAKPAPAPKPAPQAQAARVDTPRPVAPNPAGPSAAGPAGPATSGFGSASDSRQAAAGFLPAPAIVWEGKPRFRHPPTPAAYPPRAVELAQQGEALVRVRLDTNGTAVEIVLHRSSGHHSLDGAALAAVRSWHFLPAMRDGRPVPSWVEIPVRFHLR